jgi:tryptophan synthase beta chain
MPALEEDWKPLIWPRQSDNVFQETFRDLATGFLGRPTPLFYARNLSVNWVSGCTSNAKTCCTAVRTRPTTPLARHCWAKQMGKTRLIAETGAGQHGCGHGHGRGRCWGCVPKSIWAKWIWPGSSRTSFACRCWGATVHAPSVPAGVRSRMPSMTPCGELDDQRPHHALRAGNGCRAASLSNHGQVSSSGSFGDEARAQIAGANRPSAGCRRGLCRCAARMPSWDVHGLFWRMRRCNSWGSSRGGGGWIRMPHGAVLARGDTRHAARHALDYVLQDGDGQIYETHSISAALGLSFRRARACLSEKYRAGAVRRGHRRRSHRRLSPSVTV